MSSGTSFADLAHQAWDTAAQAAGLSSFYEDSDANNQDQAQSSTAEEHDTKPSVSSSSDGQQKQDSSSQPYRGAPGNHPNDPEARINHPDAVNGDSHGSSEESAAEPQVDHHDSKQADSNDTKSNEVKHPYHAHREDDMGQSIIERALGDEGMTAQRQGTIYDKQLENEMDGSYKQTEKETKPDSAAAELGLPVHSERNRKQGKGDSAIKAEDNEDAHQEHAANRGPSWASRPDDKQRAKIAKMKEEQAAGTWKRRFSSFGQSGSAGPSTPSSKDAEGKDKEKSGGLFSAHQLVQV